MRNRVGRAHRLAAVVICVLAGGMAATAASTGKKLKTSSTTVEVPDGPRESVTATCKQGTKAVSGGFQLDTEESFFEADRSYKTGGRTWATSVLNIGVGAGDVTTHAYCRDEKIKRNTETITVDSGESGTVTASCKPGTKAISGGFIAEAPGPGESFLIAASRKAGPRAWEVRALNATVGEADLTAQVNCREGRATKTQQTTADSSQPLEASCKPKQRVVAGGFHTADAYFYPVTFMKVGKRTWQLDGDASGDITAYAYCEKKKHKKN